MPISKISTIYVLGLGAIGATYAAKLHDHRPQQVKVLADAARSAAYRSAGLTVLTLWSPAMGPPRRS